MDLLNRKVILVLILISFFFGYLIRGCGRAPSPAGTDVAEKETKAQVWTCSMHPQIKLPKAGPCPLCGMDLIPLEVSDEEVGGLRELSVSNYASRLMDI